MSSSERLASVVSAAPDRGPVNGLPAPAPESVDALGGRMSWQQICLREDFRGRWVALDGCIYDPTTGRATEGVVVDVDDDLVELCARIRESEWRNCAIVFCDDSHDMDEAVRPDPFGSSAH